jgi:hypothetical protein
MPFQSDNDALALDVIWGAAAIAKAINRSTKATFYLLESKEIPGARKVGGRWCINRRALAELFSAEPERSAA